ncbi:peptidase S41 [Candidatus Saganbacteria bacterium CG08_land_8_20_14_0_20_45_16]|uniref:Peptidase S41 n=1 Tax=Candidatus Saganbacteria bacterium CG08_land_8_20_14_0_20_45_16 TaxID=2014293 RepID=A0A2H0Y1R9_UNCSA|nr:MAG: peptidase S41 [Candidatus Saganbacteria bacterium CG08_land_8_20_14_0_20_45_16]
MKELKKTIRNLVLACLIISLGFVLVTKVVAQGSLEHELETYLQVLEIVKSDYVEKKVDDQKLVYGSIRGMLQSLGDPYTRFVDPEAYKEMKIRLSGSYSGIGIYIGIKDHQLTVISPIEGTPAYKAKLKTGDKILTIDSKETEDMALEEAVSLIRGPKHSKVKLGVLRHGWKENRVFEIARESIEIKSVKTKKIDNDVYYIKLNTFENVSAAREFETSLRQAKEYKGLIVDLRNNGGGLLQNAIDIGSMFIDNGMIVQTVDRENQVEQIPSTGRVLWRKPTVVIINGASASASEILAGALKDNKVAKVLGTKSFGKACVQNVRRLSDGSAVLVTVAKYLTPSGEDINKKGVTPDIEVIIPTKEASSELALPETEDNDDLQLHEATKLLRSLIAKQNG